MADHIVLNGWHGAEHGTITIHVSAEACGSWAFRAECPVADCGDHFEMEFTQKSSVWTDGDVRKRRRSFARGTIVVPASSRRIAV